MSVIQGKAWKQLRSHCENGAQMLKMSDLIKDEGRFAKFSLQMDGLFVDFSKNRLDNKALRLLVNLAEERGLAVWIEKLFQGEKINTSESRPALHTLLREDMQKGVVGNDNDNDNSNSDSQKVRSQLKRMSVLVNKIRAGQWRGASGKAITDVVNVGVGGSDLGPLMVTHALQAIQSPIKLHFISSIDGTQSSYVFKQLDPETTLFIIASKSFTTIDTLVNAETAIHWLQKKIASRQTILKQHFIGVSASPAKMTEWGIPLANQLEFWDWVGGRYSLWSTIGFPIALKIGMVGFREFLQGAYEMDVHFRQSPVLKNIPVILALIDVWNVNFLKIQQKAILPYDARLKYVPDYLSQLVMESNGKSVDRDGKPVDYQTCPVLWGEVGSNAQHSFYQLLHQGTHKVMCDFIVVANRDDFDLNGEQDIDKSFRNQHELSLANCLAQSRVLMLGDEAIPDKLQKQFTSPFKNYPGNQPSNTIILDSVSANSIGKLIALYEHKTFVESVIWNINPFDQWGVELGKLIAQDTYSALVAHESLREEAELFDVSTEQLIKRLRGED